MILSYDHKCTLMIPSGLFCDGVELSIYGTRKRLIIVFLKTVRQLRLKRFVDLMRSVSKLISNENDYRNFERRQIEKAYNF